MKKFCGNCDCTQEATMRIEARDYDIKGTKVVAEVTILTCNTCNEEIYDRDTEINNDILLFDEYKRKNNLLTSKEVISIRVKYGLSQEVFARLLGFGAKTITRYENGAIQDTSHDTLMRLVENRGNFLIIFARNKHTLKSSERIKIENSLKKVEKITTQYVFSQDDETAYDTTTGFGGLSYGGC